MARHAVALAGDHVGVMLHVSLVGEAHVVEVVGAESTTVALDAKTLERVGELVALHADVG